MSFTEINLKPGSGTIRLMAVMLSSVLLTIVTAAAASAWGYVAVRQLLRVWMLHRVRLALFDAAVSRNVSEENDLYEAALLEVPAQHRQAPTELGVAATILMLAGTAFRTLGSHLQFGVNAVGFHLGGSLCLVLGAILAVAALLSWFLGRPAKSAPPR